MALARAETGKGAEEGRHDLDKMVLSKMTAPQRRERSPDWMPSGINYTLADAPVASMSYNAGALMNANHT